MEMFTSPYSSAVADPRYEDTHAETIRSTFGTTLGPFWIDVVSTPSVIKIFGFLDLDQNRPKPFHNRPFPSLGYILHQIELIWQLRFSFKKQIY